VPGNPEHRNAHRLQQLLDQWNLHGEVVRHGSAVCLVFLEELVPKRRARHVERANEIVRFLFQPQEEKITGETIVGVRWQSGWAANYRDGVEDLENERVAVEREQASSGRT